MCIRPCGAPTTEAGAMRFRGFGTARSKRPLRMNFAGAKGPSVGVVRGGMGVAMARAAPGDARSHDDGLGLQHAADPT